MSWRDTLRMPVGEAAKQSAARLTQSLQQEVHLGKLLRKFVVGAVDAGHHEAPRPTVMAALQNERALILPRAEVDAGAEAEATTAWPQSDGALALQPKFQPHRRTTPLSIPDFAPGERIAALYEVTRVLARNQQFTVYLAHHLRWDIDVIVKALQPDILRDAQRVQAIASGASRWSAFGLHPHIAYCYHVHFVDDVPFLIIEYLDGGNLRSWMSSGRTANLRIGLNLAIQMCHGLEHAHARGLWHGALTPENVVLSADGTLRLTDFGIAQRTEPGTDAFIAPEQWVDSHALDTQTDIFALGVCFYEVFCAGRPYEVTRGPRRKPPEPRPATGDRPFPERLSLLLKSCVDWDQGRRPLAVADVRTELCDLHTELFAKPSPFAQLPPPTWDADGWNNQAMAALALGRADEAEAAWENALTADPDHLDATYNYGITRWHRGELSDEALVQQLKRLTVRAGSPVPPGYLLALVQLEGGNAEAALPLLQELAPQVLQLGEVQEALALALRQASTQRGTTRELTGHLQFVSSVCISADATWVLSASDDNTLCLWDTASGRHLRTFEGHTGRISSLSWSDEAGIALSGSDDFTMRLWDVKRGRCLQTIALAGKVFCVSLSADGRRALSSSSGSDNFLGVDGTVLQVWDLEKKRSLRCLEGHTSAAKSAVLSADGKRVVSGSDDKMVRVWEVGNGTCVRVLEGHEHYVSCVAISADGSRVLSGGWDRTLRLWDVSKGRCLRVLKGHTGIITSLCLSADGKLAVSGGWDGTVRVWELETGRCLRTFEGHSSMVTGVALSADAHTAVSGSWDTTVRVWELPQPGTPLCVPRLSARVPYAQLPSPEPGADELVVEGERAEREHRWHDAVTALRRARELNPDDDGRLRQLARALARSCERTHLRAARPSVMLTAPDRLYAGRLGANGQRLLTGGRDERVRLWDADLQRCVRTFEGHSDRVLDVCVGASDALAVSASADWSLRVWDLAAGACLQTLTGHRGVVSAVAMSGDERAVLSGSYDHTLRLWDLTSGACVRVLKGHTRQVTAVCLAGGGQLAVSGGYDQSVRVWEVGSGRCLQTLDGHSGPLTALCISTDAQRVVSGSADGTLRIWDLQVQRCVQVLSGHEGGVTAAALSADSRWVVSAGRDGTVRLWDTHAATDVHIIHRGTIGIASIALSGDGCVLMAADGDNTIHLFELEWDVEVRSQPVPLAVADLQSFSDR